MKKLFICALMLSALASCKKETIEPESKFVTLEATCENCTVSYSYAGQTKTEVVTSSLVSTFRVDVGSTVDVSMKLRYTQLIGSGRMTLKLSEGDKEILFGDTGRSYPLGQLFNNSITID